VLIDPDDVFDDSAHCEDGDVRAHDIRFDTSEYSGSFFAMLNLFQLGNIDADVELESGEEYPESDAESDEDREAAARERRNSEDDDGFHVDDGDEEEMVGDTVEDAGAGQSEGTGISGVGYSLSYNVFVQIGKRLYVSQLQNFRFRCARFSTKFHHIFDTNRLGQHYVIDEVNRILQSRYYHVEQNFTELRRSTPLVRLFQF